MSPKLAVLRATIIKRRTPPQTLSKAIFKAKDEANVIPVRPEMILPVPHIVPKRNREGQEAIITSLPYMEERREIKNKDIIYSFRNQKRKNKENYVLTSKIVENV